ncbi:MAG: hypothetical protein AAFQ41_12560 [Cyanobacteria bacterium J06623_7]
MNFVWRLGKLTYGHSSERAVISIVSHLHLLELNIMAYPGLYGCG